MFPLPATSGNALRRALLTLVLAVVALAPAAASATAQAPAVNDPPPTGRSITAFPSRDFVSAGGYLDTHAYRVEVEHPASLGGRILLSQRRIIPTGGVIEVNHPGGACWDVNTPDIRPGDIVRIVDEDTGETDQTTVSNITAGRPVRTAPGTIEVHGTAMTVDGAPLPLDQIEQRLISPGNPFAKNGRRTLRAASAPGQDGRLAYDADGSTSWTATYTLSAADVDRALGAESRGMWLGRDPAAGTESTIFEIGAGVVGGPQAPCTAPKELLPPPPGVETQPPSLPTNVQAVVSGTNTVTLTWDAATDNTGVVSYGIYRNGQPLFDVQNPDGSAPAPTTFTDANLPPGTYTYAVDAADAVGNRSAAQTIDPVQATANPAPAVPVNEPPINGKAITAFPSRDFAEVDGFAADETGTVQIIRNGNIVASADDVIPVNGVIEVNHPGGVCWNGTTPELRAGDIVRSIAYGPDGAVRQIDQLTVANATAEMAVQTGPDTVQIHGTAMGSDGKPLPLGEIEQRLVASTRAPFELNGRRTLRAPENGTLTYDTQDNPTGSKWTATYTGLSAADVQKALTVESRVMWLGRDPLAGVELTIFEVGTADPPGPSAGFCTSPLEPADTVAPSAPDLTVVQSGAKDVKLDWTASTDDHYVYGYRVFKDGQPLRNVGRDTLSFMDSGVSPGQHTYAVAAYDSASPRGDGPTIIEQLQAGQGKPYGNLGAQSLAKSITMADVTAPTEPSNLSAKVNVPATGKPSVDLAWDASSDDVGVTQYRVFRRPVTTPASAYTVIGRPNGTTTTFKDTTVPASGQFDYTVAAVDAAGNVSTRAPRVLVTVAFDDIAPTAPTGVNALNWPDVHAKDVRITWTAATDNIGVSRYGIYRDGVLLEEVSAAAGLAYRDNNLPAGTYEYTIDAIDSVGNRSPRSALDRVIVANDPPQTGRSVEVFPSRDFVSASGYPAGLYRFEVLRGRKVISRSNNIAAVDGLVEVNHGGAPGCWNVNTPDLRAGDVVRIVGPDGVAEQTTTADLTSGRPIQTAAGTVVVHGTAADAAGNPIDLGQLEQRLVSAGANFAANGRNSLLASADGKLSYDAPGSTKWTATYTGLNAADVNRALNAESVTLWLGRDPLAGTELTHVENGPGVEGGPATPDCSAPIEPGVPLASNTPANVAFGQMAINTTVTRNVTLSNSGAVPLAFKDAYIGGANFPVAFEITGTTCPASIAAGASCTITVRFSPGSVLTARTASLNIVTDAANLTSQSIRLTGQGFDASAPTITAPAHAITPGDPLEIGSTVSASTLPVKVSWTSPNADRYELEMSRAGGAFTPVTLADPAAKSATVNLAMSNGTIQFRVRGGRDLPDGTTAWSAFANGTRFTLTAVDSAQTGQIAYGGTWNNLAVAGTLGGSVRWAQLAGDSAKLPKQTYSANSSFGVIATKGPNMGRMTVQLDGGAVTTVDLYSPTVVKGTLVLVRSGVPAGDHEVTVRPTGNRNAASTANRVELDGFVSLR